MLFTHTCILAGLLALMASRVTLNEPTFRLYPLVEAGAFASVPTSAQIIAPAELIRVASAVVIFALAAIWAVTSIFGRRHLLLRHWPFAVFLAGLAVCLFVSAARAADRREALTTAAEQTSLLLAALLVMQLARAAWQRRLVLIVLAALAAMLGAKGLYQVLVEIPEQSADFQQHRAQSLVAVGRQAGSPEAQMLTTRIEERSAKGWFGLANPFGSLMVLVTLAAIGLAVDKWLGCRSERSNRLAGPRGPPAAGCRGGAEIPLPLLAAGLSTLVAVPAVITWWLTGSIGAIGSGLLAGIAAIVVYAMRDRLARHRRAILLVLSGVFVALVAGVVVIGVIRGGLPSKTLQVRWEYWSASAGIFRDRPLLGTGPGNFSDAYLLHRRPGAEESVKNPHNVIVQALAEYGLLGGGMYLVLLGYVLFCLCAPSRQDPAGRGPGPPGRAVSLALVLGIGALALLWRIGVTHYPGAVVLVYDNLLPVVGLGVGLTVAVWVARPWAEGLQVPVRFAGVALGCGLAGFALHNLSDFALFLP
ncbi:MAG: O-antigen ligase family protein, partial [Planctomycetes bacterium]|nr:O-antigen ligase family protein [Planctomycetota bacterium]